MEQQNTGPEEPKETGLSEYFDGVKKLEMEGYQSGIKKARNALFVTGGLIFLAEMLQGSQLPGGMTPLIIGIATFEAAIFVGLGFWTRTKPYGAIIIGLILFVLMWIGGVIVMGGEAIYRGILVKAIIIYFLVAALKPAKAWEDAKKTL
jgi:hypothetical protein